MKTSKIITTIATLNLILFMSVSSIANPFANKTGDIVKKSANKQIDEVKTSNVETASTSENEFSHLRFDVNKFIHESEAAELTQNIIETLRFDVSKFINANETETPELPVATEVDYLRFNVNDFDNTPDLSEMPANEFDYLSFDANNYSNENTGTIDELPVN